MPNGKTVPMQFLKDPMRAQMEFLPIKVEYPYRRIAGGILVLVSEKGKGEDVQVSVDSKVVPTGSLQADSVEGFLHFIELERLDDRFNLLHAGLCGAVGATEHGANPSASFESL